MKYNFLRRRALMLVEDGSGDYDYGDGSLNKTMLGYYDKIYFNGRKVIDTYPTYFDNASMGNYYGENNGYHMFSNVSDESTPIALDWTNLGSAGTKTHAVSVSGDNTIWLRFAWGYTGYTGKISNLLLTIDGAQYSFATAITAKKIKPVVLCLGGGTATDNYLNILNLIDNSGATQEGTRQMYIDSTFCFMLEEGCSLTNISFQSSASMDSHFHVYVYVGSTSQNRITLSDRGYTWQTVDLGLATRTLGAPSDTTYSNATKRTWDTTTYVKGITGDNYYNAGNVTDYSVSSNSVSVKGTSSGYGVGVPISLSEGGLYRLSFSGSDSNCSVAVSFYKSDGTYMYTVGSPRKSGDNQLYFGTPSDAAYMVIVFPQFTSSGTTYTYSNIVLKKSV